jgi:hypothetical protein
MRKAKTVREMHIGTKALQHLASPVGADKRYRQRCRQNGFGNVKFCILFSSHGPSRSLPVRPISDRAVRERPAGGGELEGGAGNHFALPRGRRLVERPEQFAERPYLACHLGHVRAITIMQIVLTTFQ